MLGQLNCIIVEPSEDTQICGIAFICHGFGAPGEDLAGLASDLLQNRQTETPIRIVFPAAPIDLEESGIPGGRAWWHISIQQLLESMEEGRYELIREQVPEGIESARELLVETIQEGLQSSGLGYDQVLVGGFSQGAMLTMEVACLGLKQPPRAIALLSGALIRERQWKPQVNKLQHTKIFQSHGQWDQILPLQTGKWLRDLLIDGGCQVDFLEFQGPHTIPWESIQKLSEMLDFIACPA